GRPLGGGRWGGEGDRGLHRRGRRGDPGAGVRPRGPALPRRAAARGRGGPRPRGPPGPPGRRPRRPTAGGRGGGGGAGRRGGPGGPGGGAGDAAVWGVPAAGLRRGR